MNFLFFREAIKGFWSHGNLFPSSRFLAKTLVSRMPKKRGIVVVELGAGTGALTRQIIDALPSDGRLVSIEINPVLAKYLKDTFKDKRVTFIEGDASRLRHYFSSIGLPKADCVISGLPLGDLKRDTRRTILQEIRSILGEKGTYIQFQYLLASYFEIRRSFNAKIVAYEFRNIPPAFVYECMKSPLVDSA